MPPLNDPKALRGAMVCPRSGMRSAQDLSCLAPRHDAAPFLGRLLPTPPRLC